MNLVSVYKQGKPTPEALELLYTLLTERDSSVNISHHQMPTKDRHVQFVESRPYRCWMVVYVDAEAVGAVYLTKKNEIGVFILKSHQGHGYGARAVALLIATKKPLSAVSGKRSGRFIANVSPRNHKSIAMFERLGFSHIQSTYEMS